MASSASLLLQIQAPRTAAGIIPHCSTTAGSHRYDNLSLKSSTGNSRRAILLGTGTILGCQLLQLDAKNEALAFSQEDYKSDTQFVIQQVKETLSLDKSDPAKPKAVAMLREASNTWVAKYRREKGISGKTSFSNMYSVLNAISGHYISFGPSSAIPAKRQQRILEEVNVAANALERGR